MAQAPTYTDSLTIAFVSISYITRTFTFTIVKTSDQTAYDNDAQYYRIVIKRLCWEG